MEFEPDNPVIGLDAKQSGLTREKPLFERETVNWSFKDEPFEVFHLYRSVAAMELLANSMVNLLLPSDNCSPQRIHAIWNASRTGRTVAGLAKPCMTLQNAMVTP
ncbi:hypothetical protein QQM79_06095 [Marinobacteraceae bacterium S3BR75-40.1]